LEGASPSNTRWVVLARKTRTSCFELLDLVDGGNRRERIEVRFGRETDYCNAIADINGNNGPRTPEQWWDITGFSLPTDAEVFGDAGRSTLPGPKFVTFDFSSMKTTKLSERVSLQFRFEAFNVLNDPVFGMPTPVLDSYLSFDPTTRQPIPTPLSNSDLGGVFGSIGHTAADNRQLQFAMKFIW
jgi:hypothetical protein